jgi:hypothetical protein
MGYLERDIQQLARKLSVFKTSKESKAEKQVCVCCVCVCVCVCACMCVSVCMCVCVYVLHTQQGGGRESEMVIEEETKRMCVCV